MSGDEDGRLKIKERAVLVVYLARRVGCIIVGFCRVPSDLIINFNKCSCAARDATMLLLMLESPCSRLDFPGRDPPPFLSHSYTHVHSLARARMECAYIHQLHYTDSERENDSLYHNLIRIRCCA